MAGSGAFRIGLPRVHQATGIAVFQESFALIECQRNDLASTSDERGNHRLRYTAGPDLASPTIGTSGALQYLVVEGQPAIAYGNRFLRSGQLPSGSVNSER
jgi:hypothetical protein